VRKPLNLELEFAVLTSQLSFNVGAGPHLTNTQPDRVSMTQGMVNGDKTYASWSSLAYLPIATASATLLSLRESRMYMHSRSLFPPIPTLKQ
jgi:hypothetical protein